MLDLAHFGDEIGCLNQSGVSPPTGDHQLYRVSGRLNPFCFSRASITAS